MNIFFTGAQGVGKSTIAKKLSDHFHKKGKGYKFLDSVVRSLNVPHSESATLFEQILIFSKYVVETRCDNLISSRFFSDTYAYAKVLGLVNFCSVVEDFTLKYLKERKSKIFYIPIEFEVPNDGFRSTSNEYQKKIDVAIKDFLDHNMIGYATLSGTVENRFDQLLKCLGDELHES